MQTDKFEIKNLTPEIGTFRATNSDQPFTGFDKNYLILDMGTKSVGEFATVNFMFISDEFKITSTGAACGCTKPSFQNTPDGQFVTVEFDPSKITANVSKWFTLYLNNRADDANRIKINLIINK